jgi:2-polyprenyl-3-methyl-5-hydroxy-6-metoxy-1,4-benzoquinol methylase/ribosomal protein S27E
MTGLRVDDIRPDALMERKRGHLEADQEWLRARRDQFVRVPCPACGEDRLAAAWTKLGFSYERCPRCATVLMNPRPSEALLRDFYATSQNYAFWNEHIFPASEDARRERIFRPRVQRLLDLCERVGVRRDVLLEIGAGFGTFCSELAREGAFARVIALEPAPDLAATCRERGLETLERMFERHVLPAPSVDVVAAFEVLEHVFSPPEFVSTAAEVLRPDGLLVVSVPSIQGFDTLVLGRDANAVDHEHLNYFTPDSLALLLERHGFEVEELLTPGRLDVDLVRRAHEAGLVDLDDQPFLRHLLLERPDLHEAFQDFLADHRLSSHLWAVGRRAG